MTILLFQSHVVSFHSLGHFLIVKLLLNTWQFYIDTSVSIYHRYRDGTNIEVRVEIETHPRGARQSSLSSILSSRSLSVESLGHSQSQSQSQDYMCASELEGRREGGGGSEEEQEGREKPGGEAAGGDEGTPVFEIDGV